MSYDMGHVIFNNVAFGQVKTQMNLCSLLLSIETPNDVNRFQSSQTSIYTSHVIGNSVAWVRYQVQLKPIHTKTSLHLEQLDLGSTTVVLSK